MLKKKKNKKSKRLHSFNPLSFFETHKKDEKKPCSEKHTKNDCLFFSDFHFFFQNIIKKATMSSTQRMTLNERFAMARRAPRATAQHAEERRKAAREESATQRRATAENGVKVVFDGAVQIPARSRNSARKPVVVLAPQAQAHAPAPENRNVVRVVFDDPAPRPPRRNADGRQRLQNLRQQRQSRQEASRRNSRPTTEQLDSSLAAYMQDK